LKHLPKGVTPFAMFAMMTAAAAVASLPMTAGEFIAGNSPRWSWSLVPWIAGLVLIASVLAFMGYSWSMTFNGPVLTAASLALSPLYIAALSVWLIGETLSWFHVVAIALVCSGLFLINRAKATKV
jgi:drug/metabolite transporter (DMT)-like permease